jgi:hypothetical protein
VSAEVIDAYDRLLASDGCAKDQTEALVGDAGLGHCTHRMGHGACPAAQPRQPCVAAASVTGLGIAGRACRPPESPLIINERHLNQVLTEYLRHYNTTRPHRTLGQLAPLQAGAPPPQINLADHRIRRKQVLSGLTSEYRVAA